MPRYFMHLRDGVDTVIDEDGSEMSEAAVPGVALVAARDCMAGEIHNGRLNLACRIDVHDEAGQVVHSLEFRDALEIVGLG